MALREKGLLAESEDRQSFLEKSDIIRLGLIFEDILKKCVANN